MVTSRKPTPPPAPDTWHSDTAPGCVSSSVGEHPRPQPPPHPHLPAVLHELTTHMVYLLKPLHNLLLPSQLIITSNTEGQRLSQAHWTGVCHRLSGPEASSHLQGLARFVPGACCSLVVSLCPHGVLLQGDRVEPGSQRKSRTARHPPYPRPGWQGVTPAHPAFRASEAGHGQKTWPHPGGEAGPAVGKGPQATQAGRPPHGL